MDNKLIEISYDSLESSIQVKIEIFSIEGDFVLSKIVHRVSISKDQNPEYMLCEVNKHLQEIYGLIIQNKNIEAICIAHESL